MANSMPTYGLEIAFNDERQLQCFTSKSAGIMAHLFTSRRNLLTLSITVKERARTRNYLLKGILPGDKLRFRYLQEAKTKPQSIRALKSFSRKAAVYNLKTKCRLGLNIFLKNGVKWRTGHPEDGGFSFMLGNVPNTPARAFVMAWNENENWHWQLADLYPDDDIRLRVVETKWCDEPPSIKRR
jgi:hypothetical protein